MSDSEDFDGCARECRKRGKHTLTWGRCEHGKRPAPLLGFFRTAIGEDGELYGHETDFPLQALLPWAAALTVDEQHAMLEEAADSGDPAAVIERWRRVAEAKDGGTEWARLVAQELKTEP